MDNAARFGTLTPRMLAYREAVLEKKPYIDAERALLCTEVYQANRHQPPVMRRALMLKNILEKMTIAAIARKNPPATRRSSRSTRWTL